MAEAVQAISTALCCLTAEMMPNGNADNGGCQNPEHRQLERHGKFQRDFIDHRALCPPRCAQVSLEGIRNILDVFFRQGIVKPELFIVFVDDLLRSVLSKGHFARIARGEG